jgi:hypothetical protein
MPLNEGGCSMSGKSTITVEVYIKKEDSKEMDWGFYELDHVPIQCEEIDIDNIKYFVHSSETSTKEESKGRPMIYIEKITDQ